MSTARPDQNDPDDRESRSDAEGTPKPEPGDSAADGSLPAAEQTDAIFADIVANYGDRPELPRPPRDGLGPTPELPPSEPEDPIELLDDDSFDPFVPPDPPPVPRPAGPRLMAWLGVLVVPAFFIGALVAHLRLAGWLSGFLILWFIAGFGYLVWQLPPSREDPWDDGAQI